ncbi:unnamed protein product [Rhizophagus irregularis]|nr:unnamed protein product [Rhizophagus irregularis]
MNIIALMPATEAYEILLRNWGGYSDVSCCVWEEDYQRNFLTYIPPASPRDANASPHNGASYCFVCSTFDGMEKRGGDLRNGILTQQTLDNTTTYWVNVNTNYDTSKNKGGYNKDTCYHVYADYFSLELDEAPYEECEKIRDSK